VAESADKFDVSVTFELESGGLATYRIVHKGALSDQAQNCSVPNGWVTMS